MTVMQDGARRAATPGRADEFMTLAEPHRRELLAHCYRMTGSIHDAEDLVQDTFVRGWKAYGNFKGDSSLRTWLYRIATNTCLTSLEGRSRRPLPSGLGAPSSDPSDELVERHEIAWLEPFPSRDSDDDPATTAVTRDSVRLAFVAALQHLSARQRAVLVLREVLQWKAAEVAELLGTSTAAVNSLLQRARGQIEQIMPSEDDVDEPESPETRELLQRYVEGFETYDIDGIVKLFAAEAVWEMPPFTGWYRGPTDIGGLISTKCPATGPESMRMVETVANGQPAFGLYMLGEDGVHRAFQLHVLEIVDGQVAHVTCFFDLDLFERFGLPATYPG
ncbi:sigma-70 family RNA polymerase sigma factor [Rhodococcus kroppenstedtii]|uniref:RNA polymerase sigma factor n=2 Tax=Mycobacteriales TaxID=85007 RepID=A0ABS7NY20_9NOCA|nr:ECF RNA polymerase sigma factor SigG [Rhodococcus sp. PBTS 1]MBY6314641.1 sigma-70 family RNA polymerase sigma factor [Rhodococcus kroppenstedtii]MBY6322448.1 sigma-70 family RNA polymerase sigma factor [Rhodococcus kroppenstedtii]MBY6401252.1 sigma-70 family RNA polymerase sigma factor [Rhodococcus kroppenstedtii]